MAKGWVGTISPGGVLSYMEEESRAASGRPATPSSCATGPTPTRSATATTARSRACSTWRRCRRAAATTRRRRRSAAGTSRCRSYSPNPEAATALAMLHGLGRVPEGVRDQGSRTCRRSSRSTTMPEIAAAQPLVPRWKDIFLNAVPRPSAPTKVAYNEVSSKFWTAVHDSLSRDRHRRGEPRDPRARPRRDEGRRLVAPPAGDAAAAQPPEGSCPPADKGRAGEGRT